MIKKKICNVYLGGGDTRLIGGVNADLTREQRNLDIKERKKERKRE